MEPEDSAAVLAVTLLNDRRTDPCVSPFGFFPSDMLCIYISIVFSPFVSSFSSSVYLTYIFFPAVFLCLVDSSFCALQVPGVMRGGAGE